MEQNREMYNISIKGHKGSPAPPALRVGQPSKPCSQQSEGTRVAGSNTKTRQRPRFTTPELMRFMPCYPDDPIDYGR
jgi:hypothetical protein